MTCSHLINTYTNSRFLYRGVSRFRQTFTCGKCSSCISKMRTDWRVRTYYESSSCLSDKRNFVLFDTLTYCDDHIKHYSDIFPDLPIPTMLDRYCFSRDDVQKFFKRLRINLKRSGYKYDSTQLRYIVTSEYGSSEKTYGFLNTHRPHYHILFFVSFPISPIEFSRFVSRSWYLGKTDGVRPCDDCSECPVKKYCKGKCIYQSADYVINERLVSHNSEKNCMKCVNYITKYISKDMYISDLLQFRVDMLWRYLYPDFQSDIFLYKKYRVFCNQVLPFHLQSQCFGLSLLHDKDELKYILNTGLVHLPTSDREVIRSVSVPRYYQRKLFYDYKKIDGRVKWFLTPFGVDYKVGQLDHKIKSFMTDFRSFDHEISESRLYDLALYKIVYRGTLSDYQSLLLPYDQYYRKLITPHDDQEKPLYYNFCTKRDKMTIGSFLSTRYVVTADGEIKYKGKQLHSEFIPYDGYYIVNEKICPYWIGFEKRLNAYDKWRKTIAINRDIKQSEKDRRLDYYKQLGLISAR